MYIVRDIMYCKPGKVRPLVEKFKAMNTIMTKRGIKGMRLMTDVSGRYWTVVAEMEIESIDKMMEMMGPNDPDAKEYGKIMEGYHDLVDVGHREIYKLEG